MSIIDEKLKQYEQFLINQQKDELEKIKKRIENDKFIKALEEANKVMKSYYKKCVAQGACSLALGAVLSTLSMKALNAGYPFYIDDIKYYREIETIIDENGNIEEKKGDYNIPEPGLLDSKKSEEGVLYNYPTWGQILTGEYVRYIEKYSIGDLTAEEIVDLLAKDELDLKSFGEPHLILQTSSSADSPYIGVKTVDINEFIIDKEPSDRNNNANGIFILGTLSSSVLLIAALISNLKDEWFISAKRTKEEYNKLTESINQLEEECVKLERSLKQ